MHPILRTTITQINPIVGDLTGNVGRILSVVQEHKSNTDMLIFPELCICGYPPDDLVLKPFFLDQCDSALDKIVTASLDFDCALIVSGPEADGEAIYNTAFVVHSGKIIHKVRKQHLPNYGVFDEKRIFKAADNSECFTFKDITIGLMVCEDMWFSDVSALLKKQGAHLLISVNASPYELNKSDTRQHYALKRVEETELPLIYVNQVGGQDEVVFDGGTFIMHAQGQIIYQGKSFEEDFETISWHKDGAQHLVAQTHRIETPPDDLEVIYAACVLGLRDYVFKNGFKGGIIGLSGGIDSALTAAMAVDALGAMNVRCVMMPSDYTSDMSLEDAEKCAKNLGVVYENTSIEPALQAYSTMIPDLRGVAHENIQSRSRGVLLMALSNLSGYMVISTGNKSEMAVGYATLYGDMCGGFNPLKDLYKTEVYALSNWRNKNKPVIGLGPIGKVIPERIITRPPTAELRPDQTDQDSLPEYEVLDDILRCLIERDMGVEAIIRRGHDKDLVSRVWRMLDIAEYKRRQACPGVKITSRAFGRDRRYPITNKFFNTLAE
jgi:NAD+ synthase